MQWSWPLSVRPGLRTAAAQGKAKAPAKSKGFDTRHIGLNEAADALADLAAPFSRQATHQLPRPLHRSRSAPASQWKCSRQE